MATPDKVFGHVQDTVGHAVKVGCERLCDDRDPHAHNVKHVHATTGHYALTGARTVDDISAGPRTPARPAVAPGASEMTGEGVGVGLIGSSGHNR
jgi:hypothetical protein